MKTNQSPQQTGSIHGRCRAIFFLLFGLCCVTLPTASARVIFVHAAQTNNIPDDLSWETAFPSVQQAVDASAEGDALWVAASIYFENIRPRNGVALYGGFVGTESQLEQRNFSINRTVLDGSQTNRVVVFAPGATNTTRLDGFVIRNGLGVGPYTTAGGGIFCSNTSPAIVNNFITGNKNGAIFCWHCPSPLIAFNLIQQNVSDTPICAGIECFDSAPKIYNNRIIGNLNNSGFGTGGIDCYGESSPEIFNNLIIANRVLAGSADRSAGGICVWSPGAPRIINNTIAWNDVYYATRGIWCDSTQAVIANNIIAFNKIGIAGVPGMAFQNNCVFGNSSTNFSGFPDPTGTDGNISVDPGFAPNNYFPATHLTPGSPCRDAGSMAVLQPGWVDLDGEPRLRGVAVDIGADEFDANTPPFTPAIIRVSPTGNDTNDGSSWAAAKRTIQVAIDAATVSAGEVWVHAGAYNECVGLRPFVYLYGGFAGSETSRDQRDWKANRAILDGGQRGTSVITISHLMGWSRVDGLVIQNGRAELGGGIYVDRSQPVIVNSHITGNVALNPTNTGSSFTSLGGGVYLTGSGSSLSISNNIFSSNTAHQGGAVYGGANTLILADNNRFQTNLAHEGGGAYVAGDCRIVNNLFQENVASNALGSAFASGGALACVATYQSSPQILGNTFMGNRIANNTPSPDQGGAIYAQSTSTTIANNIIVFGSSGIYAVSSGSYGNRIRNNCVYGNTANYSWTDLTGTNGNVSVDPLFSESTDFHLAPGSPCINAGDDGVVLPGSLDLDGQARIAGPHVDIGADEYGSAIPFRLTSRIEGPQMMLSVNSELNRTYVFETSSDLVHWIPFTTNCATNSSFEIAVPPLAPNSSFYRARTE